MPGDHCEGRRKPHPARVGRNAPAPLCAILLIGVGAPTQRRVTIRPPLPSQWRLPPLRRRGVAGKKSVPADHVLGHTTLLARHAGPGRGAGELALRWRRDTSSRLQLEVSDITSTSFPDCHASPLGAPPRQGGAESTMRRRATVKLQWPCAPRLATCVTF
jgi:hypothetical protein